MKTPAKAALKPPQPRRFANRGRLATARSVLTSVASAPLFAVALLFLLTSVAQPQPQSVANLKYATNFTSVTYFEPPNDQRIQTRLSGSGGLAAAKCDV